MGWYAMRAFLKVASKTIMMLNKKVVFLWFFLLSLSGKSFAQYSEAGFGVGFATYWGDLNGPVFTSNFRYNSDFALQLNARKVFKRRFGIHPSLSYGTIQADDARAKNPDQLLRNLSFKSPVLDVSLLGEYYIFPFEPDEASSLFYPYAAAGVSGFYFNPSAILEGQTYRLQPLGTEGQGMPGFPSRYTLLSWALSLGGGAKIPLAPGLNLGLEVVMRTTFTDYLDDVSTIYVNYYDLEAANGITAARLANRMNEYLGVDDPVQLPTGTLRGGKEVKDYFLFTILSLNFMIHDHTGKRKGLRSLTSKCPKF
jgi:hypothetical protein